MNILETNICYNESCFDTFARLEDKFIDHVFTSPPYNRKRNDKYKFYNDIVVDYFEMLERLIDESIRVSKGYVFINIMKNYYNSSDVYKIFGKYHNKISEVFIWEKSNPLPASGFSITNSFEYIIVFGEKGLKSNKTYTKNHLTTSVTKMPIDHKAVMNKKVSDFFVKNFMKEGQLCFDPFMGTGTTALSCIENKVTWLGSEISKEYCENIEHRIKEQKNLFS